MAVFSNPSRAQFQRFDNPGQAPASGQPGSFAVNLVDARLWTFDNTGTPVLLSGGIAPFSSTKSYPPGVAVIQGDTIYIAPNLIPPGPFVASQWTALTGQSSTGRPAPSASGLVSGGTLTLVTGNLVNIAAGSGIITDITNPSNLSRTDISWSAQTVVLPANGATARFVSVGMSGTPGTQLLAEERTVRRTRVVLGILFYDDAGNIIEIANTPQPVDQTANDFLDLRRALGGAFKVSGGVMTPSTGRRIAMTEARVFAPASRWRSQAADPNVVSIGGGSPIVFDVVRADATAVVSATSDVPNAIYEAGAIPAGFATIHYLFGRPGSPSRLWLQLGQRIYTSLAAAQGALATDWRAHISVFAASDAVVFLGAVLITSGATDLTNPLLGRVTAALPGPRLTATFDTPSVGDEFLRRDGSTPMSGLLDMSGFPVQNAVIDEGSF